MTIETSDSQQRQAQKDEVEEAKDLAGLMTIVQDRIEDLCAVTGVTKQQATVLLTHQTRITPVHDLVARCIKEIDDNFNAIPLTDRIHMLDKISATYQRLIPLERQSYGIPEAKNRVIDTYGDPFEDFLNELSDRVATKVNKKPSGSGEELIDAEVIEEGDDFALPGDTYEDDLIEIEEMF